MKVIANGIELYYEVTGKGPALLLLHGNGEDGRIYRILAPALARTHTVYALDSRSHGKSQKGLPVSYELMAADTAAFIEKLHLTKPVVFGFSDGGIIALLLAIDYPQLVSKIIAAGPNVTPDGLKRYFINFVKFAYAITKSPLLNLMLTQPNITSTQLSGIKIPAVILAGERDIVLKEHISYIAESIPDSLLEIIPKATHSSYVVKTTKLYEIIKNYV